MNSHLHHFVVDHRVYYSDPMMGLEDTEDENDYQLDDLLQAEKAWLRYEYDFGDGWLHKIVLEKILPPDENMPVPRCIKGKRACPPEDCGGVWGYMCLLDILNDPTHPEHEEMLEWHGEIDPEEFDMDGVNEILARFANN